MSEPQNTPPDVPADTQEVRVRRAPKVPAFLILGAGLGAIVTYILTALYPADPLIGFGALFAYFALFGIPAGTLLGALVALTLDFIASRRAKVTVMQRETVTDALD
ncbi:MAG: hypothetical protein LH471_02100 [Salinibacterium sp.]|nr:hypothetical protein [Salinibacterium sp.]